ncbi:MAG TPA: glycosyltransferase family 2 protein [Planctomycetota bacterium]|nr:glycosyltransferase family 2 protein [Planctomycetota bacterium]
MKISVCIICQDEEKNIRACLESVRWADEIVVVDSGSKDRTVEIAKEYTPKVIHNPWGGYNAQRMFSIQQASGDWVLCLDADERCGPGLADEIRRSVMKSGEIQGFYLRRHTFYLGKWVNHSGWYPDWKLRLARRAEARAAGVEPHDRLEVPGPTRRIKRGDILHFTYSGLADHIRTADKFSDVSADVMAKEGVRPSLFKMLVSPWIKFLESYLWKLGFLDGRVGFVISVVAAFSVFARHVKLWERTRPPRPPGS